MGQEDDPQIDPIGAKRKPWERRQDSDRGGLYV
jgi:hypothetical protein